MIKFDLYKSENNYNCHFNQIGSFVVSIAHFMRAYFNNQAIANGKDFSLPGDAGYLNVSAENTFSLLLSLLALNSSFLMSTFAYYVFSTVCHVTRDGLCRL